jgi:predicted RNase H-like HicB family nuclease
MENSPLFEKAKALAMRPYTLRLLYDDSVSEDPLYVAVNPELDGCVAEGETVEEAEANLAEFRVEYIEHLLKHGLPIPPPASTATTTGYGGAGELKLTNVHVSTATDTPEEGIQITSRDVVLGASK